MSFLRRLGLNARLTPVVMWLIGIYAAFFLILGLSGHDVAAQIGRWLVLTPSSLVHGEVWKLVTTTFVTTGALAFLLDLLVLWLFLPNLERSWGSRRFLRFFAITTIAANLVGALFGLLIRSDLPIVGLEPFMIASMVAFGIQWGDQPVQFFGVLPLKARTLAIGIVIIMVIQVVLNRLWVQGIAYLTAIGVAAFLVGTPSTWMLRFRRARLASKKQRLMKRYTVLSGGRSKKSKDGDENGWMN